MHFFCRCFLVCALAYWIDSSHAENSPRLYAVELSATVQTAPAQINLQWSADTNATSYTVSRKALSATNWTQLTALPGDATFFADVNVSIGSAFEYQVLKSTSVGYTGSGYIYSGIRVPIIENRGKIILVVDNTYAPDLSNELAQLQQDLVGDGWTVIRHDVPRDTTVPAVKGLIQADYSADPTNVRSVFLFGHVAVPYSGNFNPDGHPNHQGAWPADVFYGDMDGTWTDTSVNSTNAERSTNWNIPGDGKFDQSTIPSDVELQVGRVDLSNMTCYANKVPSRSELDLLRQYLNKDHKFRNALLPLPQRGIVCDNFGEASGEAFAANGWRNFAAFFGGSNNVEVPYGTFFSTLNTNGYLWAYGTGGGSWYTCNGIGSSDDFALGDIKAVFTMFLGSYFGDWDNESNFLRAPLGSTSYTLATAWAGRPNWFFHHMALGETIGYSTRLSQNNQSLYRPANYAARGVHIALLGDPSLRMHPVIPPGALTVLPALTGTVISWLPSADANIQGYAVYRATSPAAPFTRISGSSLLNTLNFADLLGSTSSVYMVRAIKLETSGSGTYFNPSEGVFSVTNIIPQPVPTPPIAPSSLKATAVSTTQINLIWQDNSSDENGFKLYRKTGSNGVYSIVATLAAGTTSYSNTSLTPGTTYYYAVSAYNANGESAQSNESSAVTQINTAPVTPSGVIIRIDTTTQGNWKGSYGQDGYMIAGDSSSTPQYAIVTPAGTTEQIWDTNSTTAAALQRVASTNRVAACWSSTQTLTVQFSFSNTNYHRVVFYFLDYDALGRVQNINLYNSTTGALLSSRPVSAFQNGVYHTYDLRGNVTLKIYATSGSPVLSGIFFGSSKDSNTVAPVISPASGTVLTNGQLVSITSASYGATIRYTLDGTVPGTNSILYTGPFALASNTTVKAVATRFGLIDSVVANSVFTVPTPRSANSVQFISANSTGAGTWKGAVGTDGYSLPLYEQSIPSYAKMTVTGNSDWIWEWDTTDIHALQKPDDVTRVASCSYSSSSFAFDLNFTDGKTHNLSLYALDWDLLGRSEKLEVLDAASGAVLHSYTMNNFQNGVYLTYALKGHITIRVTNLGPGNAVISGAFFNPATITL